MEEIREMQVQSLGWEDPLEEKMTTHYSILAWRIPWIEEPGRLQSIESHMAEQLSTQPRKISSSVWLVYLPSSFLALTHYLCNDL